MSSPKGLGKRKAEAEPASASAESSKRARISPGPSSSNPQPSTSANPNPQPQTLTSWLNIPTPSMLSESETLSASAPIFDKDSIFIGYAIPLSSDKPASFKMIGSLIERIEHTHEKLPDVITGRKGDKKGIKPNHNMWAANYLALRKGTKGIKEDDYEPKELANDDGEKFGGEHLIKVLREEGVSDVLVVCSRWFGGTLLGPARFAHIENCAREALEIHVKMEEVRRLRTDLEGLDDTIEELREELRVGSGKPKEGEGDVGDGGGGVKLAVTRKYRTMTDTIVLERLIKGKTMTVKMLVDKVAVQMDVPDGGDDGDP